MDYIQIDFNITPYQSWAEILTQELAEINFESFTEENNQLQGYIPKEDYDEVVLSQLIKNYRQEGVAIEYSKKIIPSQNWNAQWESDYQPVEIEKDLLIRAPFHDKNSGFKQQIEIQPQMSFGTGHHQTTYLLCKAMLQLDFKNKKVLDVGTGTGVLGILASLNGAENIFGTDIDANAVENAKENCIRNNVKNFTILTGDIDVVPKNKYHVILANINKNILIKHMGHYEHLIYSGGILMLSGFFTTDVAELMKHVSKHTFVLNQRYEKDGWAVLQLIKK